jgi:hypothetical protein
MDCGFVAPYYKMAAETLLKDIHRNVLHDFLYGSDDLRSRLLMAT